jgi:hypothetical protein
MPEYLSPGVYIEEVATGAVPIQGVGTSTAGFLGRTERGPERARQVNSFAEFRRLYGGFTHYRAGGRLESTYLAYAVDGFFRNGGTRCVIGRIVPDGTPTASTNLADGEPPAGTPPPTLSTGRVDFGSVAVGDDATVQVTVANPADGERILRDAISVGVRGGDGDDFAAETAFAEDALDPGESMDVDVTFEPATDAGGRPRTATLAVAYSDRDELTATLLGDAPDPATATHVLGAAADGLRADAGTVILGEDADVDVTIRNLTGADVPDGDVTVGVTDDAHGDFSVAADLGAPIPANDSADVTVSFDPQPATDTERTARLTVVHDGTEQFAVTLVGEASSPLAPANESVAFGTVPPGESSVERLQVTNEGPDVAVDDVAAAVTGTGAGEFQASVEAAADPVTTGDTLTVSIRFAAAVADTRAVTLSLTTPAGEPAATVAVTANAGPVAVDAIGPGVWGRNVAVLVDEPDISTAENPLFTLTLRYWADDAAVEAARRHDADPDHPDVPRPDREEVYPELSPDESSPDYYLEAVDAASTLVRLERKGPGIPATGGGPVWLAASFTEAQANEEGLTLGDVRGRDEAGDRTGFAALAAVDEVAIVCVPDEHSVDGVSDEVVSHCESLEDRFAVLQTEQRPGPVTDIQPPGTVRSDYAAYYYPWIEVLDPETNLRTTVPPGGHVAGIYARSDQERGVHKAPANEVVRGAQALRPDVTKGEQDTLNPRGVNCIRSFPGRGIRVWGARTTSTNAQWRYVNVRRLFIFVEESIEESTQWVVFEPNGERLWARVRQSVSDFLVTVWRQGALAGTSQEEAFFVNCDRTTMTQAEIDQGQLIVEVGIAPVKPAEFVIFRFSQKTADAEGN